MDSGQYKQWVVGLLALTQPQLNDVLSRIKLLSKSSQKNHTGKQQFDDRVVTAICMVLKKHGVECPNENTLKRSSAYVQSRDKFEDLATFFETISNQKIIQDAVLRESIQLLYYDLLNWKTVAISSHTILKQIHRLPSTLHRHYPGYAASGLLVKLVNQKGM